MDARDYRELRRLLPFWENLTDPQEEAIEANASIAAYSKNQLCTARTLNAPECCLSLPAV